MVELFEPGDDGGGEFGYGESAAGFGDAGEFAECCGGVVDVAEAVADGDSVECVVDEGKVHAVAAYFGDGPVFAGGEHALGEIAGDAPGPGFGEFHGGDCGAGGEVKYFVGGFELETFAGAATPSGIKSGGEDGVSDVVVFSYGVEHASYFDGFFVQGCFSHAD